MDGASLIQIGISNIGRLRLVALLKLFFKSLDTPVKSRYIREVKDEQVKGTAVEAPIPARGENLAAYNATATSSSPSQETRSRSI